MGFSYIYILPVISAILLILSFPLFDFGFLVWIALIPLFFFIYGTNSKRTVFIGSFITGLLFFGITMRWFFDAWPLNWAGITSLSFGFSLVAFVWIVSITLMAFLFGLFGTYAFSLRISWRAGLGIAALFVFLEYARSWLFIIPWVGEQTSFGPHWSFLSFAYALHNQSFILSLAPWIGIYGISFLIILINWNVFLFFTTRSKKSLLTIGVICALSFVPWPTIMPVGEKIFALVQTNFSALAGYGLSDTGPSHTRLIQQVMSNNSNVNVIVFPEGSGWLSSLSDNFTKPLGEEIRAIIGEKPYIIVDHNRVEHSGKFFSRLMYFENGKGIVGYHDKTLLVPGGEYIPYSIAWLSRLLKKEEFVGWFDLSRGFVSGTTIKPTQAQDISFGGLVCSGIASPTLNNLMTTKGAHILLNISSDAVFGGSPLLIALQQSMAQLHAAQNQRYFLQAANGGLSYIINERGRTILETTNYQENILIGPAKLISYQSIATRFGWLLPFVFLIVSIFVYAFFRKPQPTTMPGSHSY